MGPFRWLGPGRMRAALWGWGLAAVLAEGARTAEWLSEGPPELGLLLSLPPGVRDGRRAHVECSPADVATDDGRAGTWLCCLVVRQLA